MERRVFVVCAALEADLQKALGVLGVHGTVVALEAALHLNTRALSEALERVLSRECCDGTTVFVIYGRCSPDISAICSAYGVRHLPVENCYHLYLGDAYERLLREEPGTYFMTDFLADNFDVLCIRGLGLDCHPKLRSLLFRHYTRVVYIDPLGTGVTSAVRQAAEYLDLPVVCFPAQRQGFTGALARALDVRTEARTADAPTCATARTGESS